MKSLLVLFLFIFSYISFSQNNSRLIPYKKGNYWGFSNIDGKILIAPQFDTVDFFNWENISQVRKNKLIGYINKSGKILVPIEFNSSYPAASPFFIVEKNKKFGIIDTLGKYHLALQFDSISQIDSRFFLVGLKGHFGVYGLKNNTIQRVVPISYDKVEYVGYKEQFICKTKDAVSIYSFEGVVVSTNKESGDDRILDELGERGTRDDYPADDQYPKFIPIQANGKKGLIVKTKSQFIRDRGKILADTIYPRYDSINAKYWYSNCYVAKYNGKWGAVDLKGKAIIEFEYSEIDIQGMQFQTFVNDKYRQIFVVKKGNYWGLIGNINEFQRSDYANEVLIPFNYDKVDLSNQSFYIVKSQNKFGVIWTKNLKLITAIKYFNIKTTYNRVDDFILINVVDEKGKTLYVGENGVEFFEK